MSRKLMLSSIAIAATATLLGVGTFAKWTDSEDSATISVKAGQMDLIVTGESLQVTNAVPGSASPTKQPVVTLLNEGQVDGTLYVKVVMESNDENGLAEPERELGWDTEASGELADNLLLSIVGLPGIAGLNLSTLDSMAPARWGSLDAGQTAVLAATWSIPATAGNEIMTDGVSFHLEFTLEQIL